MNSTLLHVLVALIPVLLVAMLGWYIYRRRVLRPLTTSEWLAGMRKLNAAKPSKPMRSRIEGRRRPLTPR